jgi:periplasmic divalent cation tolerance protein
MKDVCVVFVTVPSEEIGEEIARNLLEERLAACVSIQPPMRSLYLWEGKLCDEEELLLVIKTTMSRVADRLIPAVRERHPYDVPEIIALPVEKGLPDYLSWIHDTVAE